MRTRTVLGLVIAAVALGATTTAVILSAAAAAPAPPDGKGAVLGPSEKPLAEGPIHYAAYEQENGKVGGFTRLNDPKAVPGGSGSWNERRYGRLYREYLVVTKPSEQGWGTLVIPTSRLQAVQFVDE